MADSEEPCTSSMSLALLRLENLSLDDLDISKEDYESDILVCTADEDDLLFSEEDEDMTTLTEAKRRKLNETTYVSQVSSATAKPETAREEKVKETSIPSKEAEVKPKKGQEGKEKVKVVETTTAVQSKKEVKREKAEQEKGKGVKRISAFPPEDRKIERVMRVNLKDILNEKDPNDSNKDCFYSPKDTEDPVEQILADLEKVYVSRRSTVIREDGFISTPLHALKKFAQNYDQQIHNEFVVLPHAPSGRSIIHVRVVVGRYWGVGEAFKGRQAAQMAALDVLLKIQENISSSRPSPVIPYTLFPGWRIKMRVIRDLADICHMNGLKTPKFQLKSNPKKPDVPLYTVVCTIGGNVIAEGHGDQPFAAKKLAAYESIASITGAHLPKEFVALGAACTPMEELIAKGFKPRNPQMAPESGSMETDNKSDNDGDVDVEAVDLFQFNPLQVTIASGSGGGRKVTMPGSN